MVPIFTDYSFSNLSYVRIVVSFFVSMTFLVACASSTPTPRPTAVCSPFEEYSEWASCIHKENEKASIIAEVAVSCGGFKHCLRTHAEAINELIEGLGRECVPPANLKDAWSAQDKISDIMRWEEDAVSARIDLDGYELDRYLGYNFEQWQMSWDIYLDTLRAVKSEICQ